MQFFTRKFYLSSVLCVEDACRVRLLPRSAAVR
jgi:hypothetical protein